MAILIETTDDFLRALRENEEFLAAARREIYTQDLVALPGEFREYSQKTDARLEKIDRGMTEMRGDITEIRGDITEIRGNITEIRGNITEIRGDITEIRGDITEIRGDIHTLHNNVNDLHGFNLERKMTSRLRQQLGSAFGLSKVRAVWTARNAAQATGRARAFERQTEEATDKELITDIEADRLIDTDMILTGTRMPAEDIVYIAVEASGTIKSNDIQCARESAAILNRLYGAEAFPAVYGYHIDEQQITEARSDAENALLEVRIFLESDRS